MEEATREGVRERTILTSVNYVDEALRVAEIAEGRATAPKKGDGSGTERPHLQLLPSNIISRLTYLVLIPSPSLHDSLLRFIIIYQLSSPAVLAIGVPNVSPPFSR